jgi:uncharacterized repeat protein (TIGR01451 family)
VEYPNNGYISNTAQAASVDTPDPNAANNVSTANAQVDASADVSIVKTAANSPAAGDQAVFSIAVENHGPSAALGVTVLDAAAALASPQYSLDGGQTWTPWGGSYPMGTLQPGETRLILLRGEIPADSPEGTVYSNTASVITSSSDPDMSNNTSTAQTTGTTRADLTMTKVQAVQTVSAGGQQSYALLVQNNGPSDAQRVVITDALSPSFSGAQYSADGGNTWHDWNTSYAVGTLPAGSGVQILLRGNVRPTASGLLGNTAEVSSETPDPDPGNNKATAIAGIYQAADLRVTKTGSVLGTPPNQTIEYTLSMENLGPGAAENAEVADALPTALANAEVSTDAGISWQSWAGRLPLGTLGAGESRTILLRADVRSGGVISNTAVVSSSTADGNQANNMSTVTSDVSVFADVALSKTSNSAGAVNAGRQAVFTLAVTNSGPDEAQNVMVRDDGGGLQNPEFSLDGGLTWSAWPGSYTYASLAPGAAQILLFRGTVPPDTLPSAALRNTAVVETASSDPNPGNNSAFAEITAAAQADLAVTKNQNLQTVNAGDTLYYTLNVRNAGPSDAQNAVLEDTVSGLLSGPECSTDGGATWQPWTGSLAWSSFSAGGSAQVLLRGVVTSAAIGSILNTARITSDTPDPVPGNNSATVLANTSPTADLQIVKTASVLGAAPNQTVTYRLEVKNLGPADARGVYVYDPIPAALSNSSFSTDGGATWQPWSGSTDLSLLAAGESRVILIRSDAASAAAGPISNTAYVTAATADPNTANNSSSAQVETSEYADVEVTKTAGSAPVNAGSQAVFTVQVINHGPSAARGVVALDDMANFLNPQVSLDGGANWQPWSGSILWDEIPNGESRTVLLRGTVPPGAADGTVFPNTVTVQTATADPDPSNNTAGTSIVSSSSADLSIQKGQNRNSAQAGETVVYSLYVANQGPSDARGAVLLDSLPSGLDAPEYSTDGGATWQPWTGSLPWSLPMPAGTNALVLLRGTVRADAAGSLINTAVFTSAMPDPNPSDNTATVIANVREASDVRITKTPSVNGVAPHQTVTYTITVRNLGPSDARGVDVTDNVPPQLLAPDYSLDGITWQPWTGKYYIGALPVGTEQVLFLRGRVASGAEDVLTNTASVTSLSPDPNPANNTASANTQVDKSADLELRKTVSPAQAAAGSRVVYTLSALNNGPSDAIDVTVTDAAAGLLSPEYSLDSGATWSPWTGSYNMQSLDSGTRVSILLRGTVPPDYQGTQLNTAYVTSGTDDPNPANNSASASVNVIPSADLRLTKSQNFSSLKGGDTIVYTISVRNAGPSYAHNVVVADAPPDALENTQYSLDGGTTWLPWPASGVLPLGAELPDGAARTVLLRGAVKSTATGAMINTASVSSDTADPNPFDNSATVTANIDARADLRITKTASVSGISPTQSITYILDVRNLGPSDAHSVEITDQFPPQLTDAEYSWDQNTWLPWSGSMDVAVIPQGTHTVLYLRGTVTDSTVGQISNTASVSSQTPDPNPGNNTSTANSNVSEEADVELVKSATNSQAATGSEVMFSLRVQNNGPSAAIDVTAFDDLGVLQNQQYSLDGGMNWYSWQGSLNLGRFAQNQQQTLLLRGIAPPGSEGIFLNQATITSGTADPIPGNNTDSAEVQINSNADLQLTKAQNLADVTAGGQVEYVLNIRNAGPSDAQDVLLTDALPLGLDQAEISEDGGVSWGPWSGTAGFPSLAAGDTKTVLLRAAVDPSFRGVIRNTASVQSGMPDSNLSNNTAGSETPVLARADLSVAKTGQPQTVRPGDEVTYRIDVTNHGPSDAESTTLIDDMPSGIENPQYSVDDGATWAPWTGNVGLGTLAGAARRQVLIRGTAALDASGAITNAAQAVSVTPDPIPENNCSASTIPMPRGSFGSIWMASSNVITACSYSRSSRYFSAAEKSALALAVSTAGAQANRDARTARVSSTA